MELKQSKEIINKYTDYIFKAADFIEPIVDRGEGSYVWDVDGNKYLDINSGQFCVIFGHSYKPLIEEVTDQINKIYHTNTMTLTSEVLTAAKELGDINDLDLKKTIFLSTGSEANECAIRYAKFITGKNKIMSFNKGYHGLTVGMQSLTMGGVWARPRLEGSIHVEIPDIIYPPEGIDSEEFIDLCIQDLINKLECNRGEIAAVIVEPVLGTGGMIFPPTKYFKTLRQLCNRNDILLIFDECQTGFGRTGKWFCYQHYGIVPDILVTAKAIGMGFPVSAVTFRNDIVKDFEGKITHFSSHQNDPLGARITEFVIKHIKEKNILLKISNKGEYFLSKLREVAKENKLIRNPRGLGLMLAFDLPFELVGDGRDLTFKLINEMRREGVLLQSVRKGVTFRMLPSYMITIEEIDYFINALKKSLDRIEKYNI